MARNSKGHGSAPRISAKLSDAIDLLLSNECKTLTAAAEKAGMARQHLSTALRKPHVTAELERRVRARLGSHGLLAASATLERLSHSAISEYVQADVSKHLLALAGVKPTTDSGQGSGGGFVLKLTIGGQAVQIGAAFVQPIEGQPESGGFPRLPEAAHILTEEGRGETGGQGGDS